MSRLCKNGWLSTYLTYTKPQESPTIFHTWAGIAVIAASLGRRVSLDRGFYTLYPNLYTLLVSASGVGMKTTAGKIAMNILAKAAPHLHIMWGSLTTGYLADWMAQIQSKNPKGEAEVVVFCEEFKVFSKGLYSDSGLIENLTKLYDNGPWDYRTKGQGVYTVEKPCINLFACSTPEWLMTGSAADFIGGGFSSRIIPVAILQSEKSIAWPDKGAMEKELEEMLIKDLAQISSLEGTMFVTDKAKKLFEKWYNIRKTLENPDQRLAGFYTKKHDLVLKIAIVLSVSMSDDLVLDEEHIESALSLIGKLEANIPYAYQGIAWGEQAKFQDKVLMKIRQAGRISHSDLLRYFHFCMSGSDLKTIIQTLLDEDTIRFEKEVTKGKPRIFYLPKEDEK